MPFIELKTTAVLSDEKKKELLKGIGEIITLIPGKSEAVTMVGLQGSCDLYMRGEPLLPGAYVEVKMYKSAAFESKAALTEGIFQLLESCLNIKKEDAYVTFFEQQEWGAKGILK